MTSSQQLPGSYDDNNPASSGHSQESRTIPVVEEHLQIGKQVIESGKVNISKKVLEENYNSEIAVFKEEVIVERKPVDQYIEGDVPGIRLVGDTTIIPVIKEVVIKRLVCYS